MVGHLTGREPELRTVGARDAEHVRLADRLEQGLMSWCGASGRRYVHAVHTLIACPPLPEANVLMIRRDLDGTRHVLRIERTRHACRSLNLAGIRHRAARLGANEIHVHVSGGSDAEREAIEADLRTGLFAELAAEPSAGPASGLLC